MADQADIARKAARLEALLGEKLGLTDGPLARRVARAGRRLPARVRADIEAVSEAAALAGHPRLARQLDGAALDRAYADAVAHLEKIDPADRRIGMLLGIAATVIFNLALFAVLFALALHWLR